MKRKIEITLPLSQITEELKHKGLIPDSKLEKVLYNKKGAVILLTYETLEDMPEVEAAEYNLIAFLKEHDVSTRTYNAVMAAAAHYYQKLRQVDVPLSEVGDSLIVKDLLNIDAKTMRMYRGMGEKTFSDLEELFIAAGFTYGYPLLVLKVKTSES